MKLFWWQNPYFIDVTTWAIITIFCFFGLPCNCWVFICVMWHGDKWPCSCILGTLCIGFYWYKSKIWMVVCCGLPCCSGSLYTKITKFWLSFIWIIVSVLKSWIFINLIQFVLIIPLCDFIFSYSCFKILWFGSKLKFKINWLTITTSSNWILPSHTMNDVSICKSLPSNLPKK